MTDSKAIWLRTTTAGQFVLFALGLGLAVGGYFFWQFVAAFVWFFTFGTGAGHAKGAFLIETGLFAVHVALLSWLFGRRLIYYVWWTWLMNIGIVIALFARFVFYPWYHAPADPTYQMYTFVQGAQHYQLTLTQPGSSFDISEVTRQPNGITISLLMGDYRQRHDTLFLKEWHGPRRYLLYHHTLVGFENSLVPIPLTTPE